jgi:hypothetical protein
MGWLDSCGSFDHTSTMPRALEQGSQFKNYLQIEQLCTANRTPGNVAFDHGTLIGLSEMNSVRRSAEGMRH